MPQRVPFVKERVESCPASAVAQFATGDRVISPQRGIWDASGSDNRRFVEAVLWIARTGSPWRDLPLLFGNWNSVFKRYRDWVKAGVFIRLFEACSDEPDMEYAMGG